MNSEITERIDNIVTSAVRYYIRLYATALVKAISDLKDQGKRLRGSDRTKRLRKKRVQHLSVITEPYILMEDKTYDIGNVTMADLECLPREQG